MMKALGNVAPRHLLDPHLNPLPELRAEVSAPVWAASGVSRGFAPNPTRPLRGDPDRPTPWPRGAHVHALVVSLVTT